MKSSLPERRLVGLLSTLLFFYGFLLGGIQLVIADIAGDFGVQLTGMGMLVSAQHVAAVLAPIGVGVLADRVGKKPVLVAFAALFGAGCAVAGFATGLAVYLVGACLIGAGYSVCESLASAVMSDLNEAKSAQYINISQCLLSLGAVSSPILLQAAERAFHTGWPLVFLFCAACFLILAGILLFQPFPAARRRPEKRAPGARSLLTRQLACLVAAMVLYIGLENGLGYFMDTLFAVKLRRSAVSAYAISAYWLGMALSRFLCGLRPYRAERMLKVCFSVAAALFCVLVVSKWAALSAVACGLLGFTYGPVWGTLTACAARSSPENAAAAIGIMSTGCGLGGILYPTLMGAVSQQFSLDAAFLMLAGTAVAGLLLCTRLRRS